MVKPADAIALLVDRERVVREWKKRGFIHGQATYPPGRERAATVRETDEVILVVEGEIQIEVAGEIVTLDPGKELLIPAGVPHTIRNAGPVISRWLYGYR